MEAIYENNEEMIADFGSPGFLPVVSMTELYNSVYESKPPIVDGLLYPGTYLFVGSPKYGKSFLMLQLTYHISAGLPIWGYAVRQGTVLYLSLEDDQPRLQSRLYRMFKEEASNNLFFSTWAKKLGEGFEDQITAFVRKHPDTQLVVIDTLKRVRSAASNKSGYDDDYDFAASITNLARQLNICIIIVHHTRKMKSDDKFEMISGTNGLLGAVDGAFLLEKSSRHARTATLSVTGRDQPDMVLNLEKDTETLQWMLESDEVDLWVEPPDPVLDAVAKIVSAESPLWSGTATELVALLGIDMKPNQLSVKLNINAQRLWKEHNVRYHNSRTHAGRKIDLQLILPEA